MVSDKPINNEDILSDISDIMEIHIKPQIIVKVTKPSMYPSLEVQANQNIDKEMKNDASKK